jgi:hypothetical protein
MILSKYEQTVTMRDSVIRTIDGTIHHPMFLMSQLLCVFSFYFRLWHLDNVHESDQKIILNLAKNLIFYIFSLFKFVHELEDEKSDQYHESDQHAA